MINFKNYLLVVFFSFVFTNAQITERPFIWVQQKDRAQILKKIETQPWAKSFYNEFKQRLDDDIVEYNKSPEEFLKKIPFDWSKQLKDNTPPLKIYKNSTQANNDDRYQLSKYLQIGIDCGTLYFLSEDEKYAQCALDILYAFVEGVIQIQPSSEKGNGGWIYPSDHLREARVIGGQVPIIYDFVYPFIKKGKQPFDIGKKGYVDFSMSKAQEVFRTYAKLAVEHGHSGSNWSVLESFSLVQSTLALENITERNTFLNYYLVKGTNQQDALPNVSEKYKQEGDVFPETSQYSNGVADFTTRMLILLTKYNPDLNLGKQYYKIPFSLDRWNSIRYPNDDIVRFGDGHRHFEVPYDSYDMAYALGILDSVPKLTKKFGPLITDGLKQGFYHRENVGERSGSVTPYFTPTQLLWLSETPVYSFDDMVLPRTDKFSHAGVFLQRNLSATNNPDYGLMCFVGGGHMVHGHANGMDMELYGLGEVLGVDNGRGSYRTDIHENYSRLFAAHNSVIVNGASQGEGGWVNLGINTTKLIAMEPKPLEMALSPNLSFTRTTFVDDKGDKAEAIQERTMALVRTSSKTGYYIDVFRSKSSLKNEFHDYVYHNIGDKITFLNEDLHLKSDENRYQKNAHGAWTNNKDFRNPGWHFFKDVESSMTYTNSVKARFEIKKLKDKARYMNVFILGNDNRDYTKVMAPNTYEAPKPYDKQLTPTLVIRQKGEAWSQPFSLVYEPTFEDEKETGIESVEKLEQDGIFKGFKVISKIGDKRMVQYIVNQENDAIYKNQNPAFDFKGSFAIITESNNKLESIYIGEGDYLKLKAVDIKSTDGNPIAAYIDFSKKEYTFNSSKNATVSLQAKKGK